MNCEAMKARRQLRTFDDPALSTPCAEVERGEDTAFFWTMRDVCRALPDGVGLAAPQIGILKRAVFVWHRRRGGESLMMANPRVVKASDETETASEGCLSYPGVFGPVARPKWVDVVWTDPATWNQHGRVFAGFQGRVVQHEIDHLDGVCRVRDYWLAEQQRPRKSTAAVAAMLTVAALGMSGGTR
jgi:peptide deformylase